jgi:hypothetical protein
MFERDVLSRLPWNVVVLEPQPIQEHAKVSIGYGVLASRSVFGGRVAITAKPPAHFIGRKGLAACLVLADIAVHWRARVFFEGEIDTAVWMLASHPADMIRQAQIKAPNIKGDFAAV